MDLRKKIWITGAENRPMATDLFLPEGEGPFPLVIYAHGFAGFKDWGNNDLIAIPMVTAGLAYLRFNFSHNGTDPDNPSDFADLEAFGKNTYSKQLYDLQCVLDWTESQSNYYVKQKVDTRQIYLLGHSLGGALALVTAAGDLRIKKLVTWAAVSALKTPWGSWPIERIENWKLTGVDWYENKRTGQRMPLDYSLYEDYEQHKEMFDLEACARKLNIPWLIVHGRDDLSVDYTNAIKLTQWQPSSRLLLTEGDHVFNRRHPWNNADLPAACASVLRETIKFLI